MVERPQVRTSRDFVQFLLSIFLHSLHDDKAHRSVAFSLRRPDSALHHLGGRASCPLERLWRWSAVLGRLCIQIG